MMYYDFVMVCDKEMKRSLCLAPGFSRLKEGDMVNTGSGWLTVLASVTMSADNEILHLFELAFGPTPKVERVASVKEARFDE